MRTIVYPKSLKDIPAWRRRQITQDIQWFTRYSPAERLDYVDREWADIQNFIKEYGFQKHGTSKRTFRVPSIDDLIRLKKIRKPNVRDEQDIEYLLKAKKLRKQ